jgi:hypothetical protein
MEKRYYSASGGSSFLCCSIQFLIRARAREV